MGQPFEIETCNDITLTETILAKNVGDMLEKKYPGYGWAIHVQDGVVMVNAMRLSGTWGFMIQSTKIDNDYKCIVKYGGELLERYRVRRSGAKTDEIDSCNVDRSGNFEVDRS